MLINPSPIVAQTEPWLSVLMPIYNGERYLARALDSILLQDDPNIECIVVDGDSTDGTMSVLEAYQDKLPLRIFKRERSSNWVIKTNYALSVATGKFVCFLHHDDLWFKGRLKRMKRLIQQNPETVLFLHPSNYLDNKGNIIGLWSCPLPPNPTCVKTDLMLERLLVQNFISIPGPIFRREIALQVGGMDESLWYTADWDFWLKIAACGNTTYESQPLSGFRIHPTSQTIVSSSRSQDFRRQLEIVTARHVDLWHASGNLKARVRRTSTFSNEVNIAMAGAAHGQKTDVLALIGSFLSLGPADGYRYLRDSRIWQRASVRIKAQVRPAPEVEHG